MKDTDKMLAWFAVAAVVLVVVAFALVARQPTVDYGPEDTPQGVVSNYLLAVTRGDYERAYEYLSAELPGRPGTAEAFVDEAGRGGWDLGGGGAAVFKTELTSTAGSRAVVTVQSTSFSGDELLDASEYTDRFTMRLAPDGDTWRLVGGERYWNACWDDPSPEWCRRAPLEPPEAKEAP